MALSPRHPAPARLGVLFALLAAGSYGLNPPLARVAYDAGLTAVTLVAVRSVGMLAVAAILIAVLRVRATIVPGAGGAVLVLGVSSAILSVAYLVSVAFIPVSLAVIIFYTFPIIVFAISVVTAQAPVSPVRWLIVAGVFAGLALVIGPEFSALDWRGIGLAGLASLCAVAQFYSAAAATARMNPFAVVFWVHVIALPIVGVAIFYTGVTAPSDPLIAWGAVAVASLAYVSGFFFQVFSLMRISPATSSLYFNAEPLVTLAVAALLLGEKLSALQLAGASLVIGGLVASSLIRDRRVI